MLGSVGSSLKCTMNYFMGYESECSGEEKLNADGIREIHDLVEEVAYRAFAQKVAELGIHGDQITEEQSGQILGAIKMAAHREMYKTDGYIKSKTKLPACQVQEVIRNVGLIIHDRDTKLTDARYYSLTDMTMALDDHNTMVKETLLKSWYKCPKFQDPNHTHLEEIKERAGFYAVINQQLSFDLKAAVAQRQAFWDNYFPGRRDAHNGTSKEFVDTIEVRNYLAKVGYGLNFTTPNRNYTFTFQDFYRKLTDLLSPEDQKALFEPREIHNLVRKCQKTCENALISNDMTLGQFLNKYYPESVN